MSSPNVMTATYESALNQVRSYIAEHNLPGVVETDVEVHYRLAAHEVMVVVETEEQLKTWEKITEPFQLALCKGIHDHQAALPVADEIHYVVVRQDGAEGIIGGAPEGATQPIAPGWVLWIRWYPNGRTVFERPPSNVDLFPGRNNSFCLCDREGYRPMTGSYVPHQQLTQQSPPEIIEKMVNWMNTAFAGAESAKSLVSDSTTKALRLKAGVPVGECARVLMPVPGFPEFGHVHEDGSMHLALSLEDRWEIMAKDWGEPHPGARWGINAIMVYAPRNDEELEVAKTVFTSSYRYAIGEVK